MNEDSDLEFLDQNARSPATRGVPLTDKLRRVAKYQRAVIFALIANIVINIVAMSARELPPLAALGLLFLLLCVVVITVVSVFLVSREMYSVGVAILCSVLMLVPCISLITLLIVNQSATKFLQQQGVKVGLFGVNPAGIQ